MANAVIRMSSFERNQTIGTCAVRSHASRAADIATPHRNPPALFKCDLPQLSTSHPLDPLSQARSSYACVLL